MVAFWWAVTLAGGVLTAPSSHAGMLTYLSDTITNSAPGESGSHAIQFTVANTVPVSGNIVITFELGSLTNVGSLGLEDVDLLVNSVQQTLALTPGSGGGSAVGVAISGAGGGSVTFTLNDSDTIGATSVVTIRLGSNATSQLTGDTDLTNTTVEGDYEVTAQTETAADVLVDSNTALFIVIHPVGLANETPTPTPTATPTATPTPVGGGASHPSPTPICTRITDFNGDCRVNMTDFSILMANWGAHPRNPATDINTDGSVGIIDLSILLYWWTG